MAELLNLEGLSPQQINDLLCEAGSFEHLMHASQVAAYRKYRAWAAIDQDDDQVEAEDGALPRMFALPISKRWGKTSLCLWIKAADCILQPGTKHRYTSAFDSSVKAIINDVQREVFRHFPPSVRPTYHGNRGTSGAGFYFPKYGPAEGSILYLNGLESNPDALRGQECAGDVISEAAFIERLLYALTSIIYQQYQGERFRWARVILESSAPVKLGTDWERFFLPDAKRRDAYFEAVIDDNPLLSKPQIAKWCAAMPGGKLGAACQREYYNVIGVDAASAVIPEFRPAEHVIATSMPQHAYTFEAADPGVRDLFGLVWGFYDFDRSRLVIQASWAKQNASTAKVACVCAAMRFALWGTWPPRKMKSVPLYGDSTSLGWVDLLAGEPHAELAPELYRLAQLGPEDRPWYIPRHATLRSPEGWLTAWDGEKFVPGPQFSVSDIDHRLMLDLSADYGMQFSATDKEDLATMSNLVRTWFTTGRLVYAKGAGIVIEHTRVARWNEARTEWDRPDKGKSGAEHSGLGHFDTLAAAVYLVRKCRAVLAQLCPHPPARLAMPFDGNVVDSLPWQKSALEKTALADMFSSGSYSQTKRFRGR